MHMSIRSGHNSKTELMADLAIFKQRTSYNSGKKLFSEIRQLKTFVVHHKLGWYSHFVAHTLDVECMVTNKLTTYCNPHAHARRVLMTSQGAMD